MTGAPAAVGVLMLHGLTSSPSVFDGLRSALAGAGVGHVEAPMLAGHGTSVDDLERTTWADWVAGSERALSALALSARGGPGRPVVVVGHSMGGTLACRLAAHHSRDADDGVAGGVAGVVAINAFIDPPAESFRDLLRTVLEQGHRSVPAIRGDAADPSIDEVAYDELPVRPLLSLCEGLDGVAADLASIHCPVLVMTSRIDHVVPPVSSDILAAGVSGTVTRVWLENSYHLATLDRDRAEVERRTVAFVLERAAAGARSAEGGSPRNTAKP